MNDLMTICGVRGRLGADGTPQLWLEDVARGLGFTQSKNNVAYVRWETVLRYLDGFGFSQQVGKDSFIPENVFYKLCFKAENDAARAFQDKVTDEVLPSIRKHGAYLTPERLEQALLNPDALLAMANRLKREQQQRLQLEQTVHDLQPKALFADAVAASHTSILIGDLAKLLGQNGVKIGQNRLFERLRRDGYLCARAGSQYNAPTQRSVEQGLLETRERTIQNPDGSVRVTRTTKVTGKGQVYFIQKYAPQQQGGGQADA